MRWPFLSRRERLRREASDWIAKLNGPDAERHRPSFEQWYRTSEDHARAYDRVSAVFAIAGRARRIEKSDASAPEPRARIGTIGYAVAAAAACAVLAFLLLSARTALPLRQAGEQIAAFSTDRQSQRIVLLDGSEVLLSPGSELNVAIGKGERRLLLVRGEGRFAVAHDVRPFIVAANGTEVIARGTQFVVRLDRGRTTVALIEGSIDVSYLAAPDRPDRRRVARLQPGEQLVVEAARRPAGSPAAATSPTGSFPTAAPPAMLQFDDTPLQQAVELVNRHGRLQVRLGDSALGRLRITGAFRSGDTSGFAESVAAAFSLELERGAGGSLWLSPGAEAAAAE